MSEQKIVDNNKRIAGFMGLRNMGMKNLELWVLFDNHTGIESSELQYHTSWNWLMPVLEKIESLGYCSMICKGTSYSWTSIFEVVDGGRKNLRGSKGKSKLENTYLSVVGFIQWYNERSPKDDK